MPTIDLTDDEHAAVTAAIRRAIEEDRFPHAPRLEPLRAALAKFDAALKLTPEPQPLPKALPRPARGTRAFMSAPPLLSPASPVPAVRPARYGHSLTNAQGIPRTGLG